jgi:DNA polymerase-3 subunit delta
VKFEAIISDLKQQKYHPVYFLSGEEPYFIDLISDYIEHKVLSESEKAFNLLVLYGKEIDAIKVMDNARQFPMMANRRVVIVKEAQEMKTLASLETYLLKPSPDTILVIAHKYKKLDKRKSFVKTALKNSLFFESKKLYDNQIPAWVNKYLRKSGRVIDGKSSELIAEYLGNDLHKISNELDKLILNIGNKKQISSQDIESNIGISKDFNVFEMQNAFGSKDRIKLMRILKYFIANPKKNPLIMINIVLFNFFTKVYLTQSFQHLDDKSLAKVLKMGSSYFIKDYRVAARNYSADKIEFIFDKILSTEMRLKGMNNHHVSESELLKELTLHILD